MAGEIAINVSTILGLNSQRGLVVVNIDQQEWLISPAEARNVGHLLLGAAEAADTEEFLYGWLPTHGGSLEMLYRLCQDYRAWREARGRA